MIRFTKLAAVTVAMAATPFLAQAAEDFDTVDAVPGLNSMQAADMGSVRGQSTGIIVLKVSADPVAVLDIDLYPALYAAQMQSVHPIYGEGIKGDAPVVVGGAVDSGQEAGFRVNNKLHGDDLFFNLNIGPM
jgi:hypothetical protein